MIDNLIAKNLVAKLIREQARGDKVGQEKTKERLRTLEKETPDHKLELEIYFTLRGLGGETRDQSKD